MQQKGMEAVRERRVAGLAGAGWQRGGSRRRQRVAGWCGRRRRARAARAAAARSSQAAGMVSGRGGARRDRRPPGCRACARRARSGWWSWRDGKKRRAGMAQRSGGGVAASVYAGHDNRHAPVHLFPRAAAGHRPRAGTDISKRSGCGAGCGGRRWVLYAGEAEASAVPAEWHSWLHFTTDAPLPMSGAPAVAVAAPGEPDGDAGRLSSAGA